MSNLQAEIKDNINKNLRQNHKHLQSIDDELTSIDNKLIRGDDENRSDALEVSLYARHPNNTDLGLLHMTAGHNLKVSIEEAEEAIEVRTISDTFSTSSENISVPVGNQGSGTAQDTTGVNVLGIAGSSSEYGDDIFLYVSNDNSTYYKALVLNDDPNNGTFYVEVENPAFRYYRILQNNNGMLPATISIIYSKR